MRRVQSAAPSSNDFTYEDMFKIATRQTSAFGIEGYEIVKKHLDPVKQVKEREYLVQKKGQKNKNYVTKRGHYLEDLKKQTGGIPAPNKYDLIKQWAGKDKAKRSLSAPPKRTTFIDAIFREAKLRQVPGSGKYNIVKPLEEQLKIIEEQKKKKLEYTDRPTYLNEIMHLAVVNPGPGNYNPRPISHKVKVDQTEPKDWILKHNQEAKRKPPLRPDTGTYKPEPVAYTTFSKIAEIKANKKDNSVKSTFSKDTRFKDPTKSKSKQKQIPGPGQYPLIVNWQGKEEGRKKTTKKSYFDQTTKGVQRSIYY